MRAIYWIGKSGWFGDIIRLVKHRGITHAELLFSDGCAGTATKTGGGVGIHRFGDWGKNGAPNPLNWLTLDLPTTPAQEAKVRAWFEEHRGAPYDMRGIVLAQLFPFKMESKTAYFCSEACVTALRQVGMMDSPKAPYEIDPALMFRLNLEMLSA